MMRVVKTRTVFTLYCLIPSILISIYTAECKDILKGHLEPIFTHGERHLVKVLEGFPDPERFFREFVSRERPVVFKNAAKNFQAFQKWSDNYFLSKPQSKEYAVTVETKKKENREQPADEVPFDTFLKYYRKKDIYMVETIPKFLQKDVPIPSCIACQSILQGNMLQNVMWISSGGTQSVLHNDYAENINCVFQGEKTFYIVDRKYMDNLNVTELGYSDVDVDRVDLDKYPGLYNIEHHIATVQAGDCLYIPFLWVHQVNSYQPNIAVNFWWKNQVEVDYTTCDRSGNITVDDVTFVGFDVLQEAQYGMLKGRFKRRVRMKGPMTFEDLLQFISEVTEISEEEANDEDVKEVAKKVFSEVDIFPTDGIVTLHDVENLSTENLKAIRQHISAIMDLLQQKQNELPREEEAGNNGPAQEITPPWLEWGDSETPMNVAKKEVFSSKGKDATMTPLNKDLQDLQWEQMVENRKFKREL